MTEELAWLDGGPLSISGAHLERSREEKSDDTREAPREVGGGSAIV